MTTILLIDDEPDNLTLTSVLLSVEGYSTLRACEAADAVAQAGRQQPHLIVIDWIRADVSVSISLCQELRRHPRTRHIPIVVLGDAATAPAGSGRFYDQFLHGPAEFDLLLEHIQKLLSPTAKIQTERTQ